MTPKQRKEVFDKYNGHCAYCGCELTLKTMRVDHIVPKVREYKLIENPKTGFMHASPIDRKDPELDRMENYNPSCQQCNFRKGTFDIEGFRQEILRARKRLTDYESNYRLSLKYGLIQEMPNEVTFYFETQK